MQARTIALSLLGVSLRASPGNRVHPAAAFHAFVLRDQESLAQLFEPGAVLFAGGGLHEARGGEKIVRVATEMWKLGRIYFADPRRILQVRGTALVLAERAINVVHRNEDGLWRYSILDPEEAVGAGP